MFLVQPVRRLASVSARDLAFPFESPGRAVDRPRISVPNSALGRPISRTRDPDFTAPQSGANEHHLKNIGSGTQIGLRLSVSIVRSHQNGWNRTPRRRHLCQIRFESPTSSFLQNALTSTAHLPAIEAAPSLELKAVYSRSPKSAEDVAFASKTTVDIYYDTPSDETKSLDALLARNDISGVIIARPAYRRSTPLPPPSSKKP